MDELSRITNKEILDIEKGLIYVNNKPDKYIHIIRMYYNNNAKIMTKIQLMIEEEDHETLLRTLHTLKGVSQTIGAIRVYSNVVEMERTYKEKDYAGFSKLLESFDRSMTELLSLLQEVIKEEETVKEEETSISMGNDKELMLQLELLSTYVSKGKITLIRQKIAEIKVVKWPEKYQGNLNKIEEEIKRYKLKDAVTTIRETINL